MFLSPIIVPILSLSLAVSPALIPHQLPEPDAFTQSRPEFSLEVFDTDPQEAGCRLLIISPEGLLPTPRKRHFVIHLLSQLRTLNPL
jgi:hypothetical protein